MGKSRPRKIFIANRGEIACRIFQACQELQIAVAGGVAPHDEHSRHALLLAGDLHPLPDYLDGKALIRAAHQAQAGWIHPGIGFLSESATFAKEVEAADLGWIGPQARSIELCGDKIKAKQQAALAGVPTSPWVLVPLQASKSTSGHEAREAAQGLGFPLGLKSSTGGGGKGLRRIGGLSELEAAIEGVKREAAAGFGESGELYFEKWIEHPRHIEVQVWGDGRGGGVHFFERECSLQRRHQKIWEEAPAVSLAPETRDKLLAAALKVVQFTQYLSLGTVEFLIDPSDGQFYFLEMNTRLQVEHPVTEQVCGVDLVQLQIQQALDGYPPLQQLTATRGHALEVRLLAENPATQFSPSPGRIAQLRWPTGCGIRIESGIEEGEVVSSHYDSLLAKLIVTAESRPQCLSRLQFALQETVLLGLHCNQLYLKHLTTRSWVQMNEVHTEILEAHLSEFQALPDAQCLAGIHALLQAYQLEARQHREKSWLSESRSLTPPSPWLRSNAVTASSTLSAPLSPSPASASWRWQVNGVELLLAASDPPSATAGPINWGWQKSGGGAWLGRSPAGKRVRAYLAAADSFLSVSFDGELFFGAFSPKQADQPARRGRGGATHAAVTNDDATELLAQFPGRVREVLVQGRQHVEQGEVLMRLEAMKMEFNVQAPKKGQILEVFVEPLAAVSLGQRLLLFQASFEQTDHRQPTPTQTPQPTRNPGQAS